MIQVLDISLPLQLATFPLFEQFTKIVPISPYVLHELPSKSPDTLLHKNRGSETLKGFIREILRFRNVTELPPQPKISPFIFLRPLPTIFLLCFTSTPFSNSPAPAYDAMSGSPETESPQPGSRPQSRTVARHACDPCRLRKTRCELNAHAPPAQDGSGSQQPDRRAPSACRRCTSLGLSCTFLLPLRTRGPRKRYVMWSVCLQQKLNSMQELLDHREAKGKSRFRAC